MLKLPIAVVGPFCVRIGINLIFFSDTAITRLIKTLGTVNCDPPSQRITHPRGKDIHVEFVPRKYRRILKGRGERERKKKEKGRMKKLKRTFPPSQEILRSSGIRFSKFHFGPRWEKKRDNEKKSLKFIHRRRRKKKLCNKFSSSFFFCILPRTKFVQRYTVKICFPSFIKKNSPCRK